MTYNYNHLLQAFLETVGHIHGATFNDENIDTLMINGEPAEPAIIQQIKDRATELAQQGS